MLATTAIVALVFTAAEVDFLVLPDQANTSAVPLGKPADATRCRIIARGQYLTPPNWTYPDPTHPAAKCYTAYFLQGLTVAVLRNEQVISTHVYTGPLAVADDWDAAPVEIAFAPTDRLAVQLTLVGKRVTMQTGPAGIRQTEDVPVRRVKLVPLPNPRGGR